MPRRSAGKAGHSFAFVIFNRRGLTLTLQIPPRAFDQSLRRDTARTRPGGRATIVRLAENSERIGTASALVRG